MERIGSILTEIQKENIIRIYSERKKKMVIEICDSPRFEDGKMKPNVRYITFRYRTDIPNDEKILKLIYEILDREQDKCSNCVHYQSEGYFCGYSANYCDIHGNIEAVDHPHFDGDGSKCEDYQRKEK